eukprot:3834629-Amphidinium_carterae.1
MDVVLDVCPSDARCSQDAPRDRYVCSSRDCNEIIWAVLQVSQEEHEKLFYPTFSSRTYGELNRECFAKLLMDSCLESIPPLDIWYNTKGARWGSCKIALASSLMERREGCRRNQITHNICCSRGFAFSCCYCTFAALGWW